MERYTRVEATGHINISASTTRLSKDFIEKVKNDYGVGVTKLSDSGFAVQVKPNQALEIKALEELARRMNVDFVEMGVSAELNYLRTTPRLSDGAQR